MIVNIVFYIENYCLGIDADLPGNDLNGCSDETDTPEKCQELCQKTSDCVQITWLSSRLGGGERYKQCCMKNVMNSNYQTVVGTISGPKKCGNYLVVCL